MPGQLPELVLPCTYLESMPARLRGLLGRAPPAPGTGCRLAPCAAVHTVGMRYALDVVFVARNGHVLRVVAGLSPNRACWRLGAHAVVELAAGEAARLGIWPGIALRCPRI